MNTKIYIKTAYDKNPGTCAWGAIIEEIGGYDSWAEVKENSTNNEIILEGAIKVLENLNESCEGVELYTTSSYLADAFNESWIEKWKERRWRTSFETKVQHKELWLRLEELVKVHEVKILKVKHGSSNDMLKRCKTLAEKKLKKNLSRKNLNLF